MLAVRWYLRYGLSYRDVEKLLAERGITVDHVTVYRWVQRFTPLLIDAARPRRDRWFVDETYVKAAGLKHLASARVVSTGHAFVQNLRCGHYELGMDVDPQHYLPAAFAELALAI